MTEVARVKNNTKPKSYKQAHVRRQRKDLSSKPNQLILPNVEKIVRSCYQSLDKPISSESDAVCAGLVLAVLLTGRNLHNLVSHQLSYEITAEGVGMLGSSWVFPTPKLPSRWRTRLYQSYGFPGIVLPVCVAGALRQARDSDKTIQQWGSEINLFLATIPRFLKQTINLTRISGVLGFIRHYFKIDRFELDFIADREIEQNSQHHYVGFEILPILEKHFQYVQFILGLAHQPELLLMPAVSAAYFGSQLALMDEGVKAVFKIFEEKIALYYIQLHEREKLHNWYTMYVVEVMQLATLHRPKNEMFGSLADISSQLDSVIIIDKGLTSARRAPLPLSAKKVLKGYLEYLEALIPLVQYSYLDIKNTLVQILAQDAPIFQLWHHNKMFPINTKFIESMLSEDIPLHLNWHRHTVATALVKNGVDRAYLAALMGHDLPLDNAFSKHSALDYQGVRTICDGIEAQIKKWQIPMLKVVPNL